MRYIGFLFCSLVGWLIGNLLLTGAAAAYASVIISYHLYLVILLFLLQKETGTVEREKGLALPIGQTIITHSAFLAVVIGLPYLRDQIPFFGIIKLFIPALAPFEVKWLFSKEKKMKTFGETQDNVPKEIKMQKKGEALSIDDLINAASAEEHEIFLAYLRQPHRAYSKPGRTVREEYGFWLADRAKRRTAAVAATSGPTAVAAGSDPSKATGPPGR